MDRSTPITLISPGTRTQDDFGRWISTQPTERTVYAQVDSIDRREFFDAGRNGLNPEYKFTMFFGDYEGEQIVGYNGQTYAVYRTYRGRNDTLELYVQRTGGTNEN